MPMAWRLHTPRRRGSGTAPYENPRNIPVRHCMRFPPAKEEEAQNQRKTAAQNPRRGMPMHTRRLRGSGMVGSRRSLCASPACRARRSSVVVLFAVRFRASAVVRSDWLDAFYFEMLASRSASSYVSFSQYVVMIKKSCRSLASVCDPACCTQSSA